MTFYEAALRVLESEGRPLTLPGDHREVDRPEPAVPRRQDARADDAVAARGDGPPDARSQGGRHREGHLRAGRLGVAGGCRGAGADGRAGAASGGEPAAAAAGRAPPGAAHGQRARGRPGQRAQAPPRGRGRGTGSQAPLPAAARGGVRDPQRGRTSACAPEQIIEQRAGKELCRRGRPPVEALLTALLEDNQRRIDAGRRPQFAFDKETGEVSLERAGAPSEAPPLELQAAFAAALGIPLEDGRPVLPGEAVAAARRREARWPRPRCHGARTALKDARRAMARALRKRLGEAGRGHLREVRREDDARAGLPRAEGGQALQGRPAAHRAQARGQRGAALRDADAQGHARRWTARRCRSCARTSATTRRRWACWCAPGTCAAMRAPRPRRAARW